MAGRGGRRSKPPPGALPDTGDRGVAFSADRPQTRLGTALVQSAVVELVTVAIQPVYRVKQTANVALDDAI